MWTAECGRFGEYRNGPGAELEPKCAPRGSSGAPGEKESPHSVGLVLLVLPLESSPLERRASMVKDFPLVGFTGDERPVFCCSGKSGAAA